jgi:hypothetical protein
VTVTTGQLIADMINTAKERPASCCWFGMFLSPVRNKSKALLLDESQQRAVFDPTPFHADDRVNVMAGQKCNQLVRHVLVKKRPSRLCLKLMCGAVIEQGLDGFNTDFWITVLSLRYGVFRLKTFGTESVIVAGDGLHGQTRVFEQGSAAHFAGDDFNQRAL